MIGEIREYTLTCAEGQVYRVRQARQIAPGLLVYRIPDGMHPSSPHRWRIGHDPSGLAVADVMTEEDALKTAEVFAAHVDWTQDVAALRASIDVNDLFEKASRHYPVLPAAPEYRMRGDVSGNGIYTDADIEEAAREAKADELNAYEILISMSHTVPWMGLDTDDFNEAHNRIVTLADAA